MRHSDDIERLSDWFRRVTRSVVRGSLAALPTSPTSSAIASGVPAIWTARPRKTAARLSRRRLA